MRLRLALICALIALPCLGAAGWTNIGPWGGEAHSLALDQSNDAAFVMNARSGIYRRIGSTSWQLVFDAVARGVTPTRVAVDPQTSRVYAGTTTGLWRSDDEGESWQMISSDPVIDVTAAGDRLLVSAPLTLSRSGDAGRSWQLIDPPPGPAQASVTLVRISPSSDYAAAVIDGKLFRSDDFGSSWQPLTPTGVVSAFFGDSLYTAGPDGVAQCTTTCSQLGTDVAVDVTQWRGEIYSATADGVFRYSLPRWIRLASGFPEAAIFSLAPSSAALLAATAQGVAASEDGMSWKDESAGLANVRISAIIRTSHSLFAATLHEGIVTGSGDSWSSSGSGLPYHPPTDPVARALASDGDVVYAAFQDDGLFRSTNNGASWNAITVGLPSRFVYDAAADGGVVIAATAAGLARSSDRGATWGLISAYPGLSAAAVAVRGPAIVAASGTTAFVSSDGGATWQGADLPGIVRAVAIIGDRQVATTDGGVFVRTGGTWSGPTLTTARPAAISTLGTRLYAAASGGIYFSDDGTSWLLVPGSEVLPPDVTALFADDELLYAGTDGGSIFTALRAPRRRAVAK